MSNLEVWSTEGENRLILSCLRIDEWRLQFEVVSHIFDSEGAIISIPVIIATLTRLIDCGYADTRIQCDSEHEFPCECPRHVAYRLSPKGKMRLEEMIKKFEGCSLGTERMFA